MRSISGLTPRWASPPGETISAVLNERQIAVEQFASQINLTEDEAQQLLLGTYAITLGLARDLSRSLGGATEFWMTREAQYREDLTTVYADQWAEQFPVNQMAELGWINRPTDWHQRIEQVFEFFDIEDVKDWESEYEVQISDARFRSSKTFSLDHATASVWFRACERAADLLGQDLKEFDVRRFEQVLPEIRTLTKRKDPRSFIPELTRICASVGVAVVVVPAPSGCPASGAARMYKGRPLIQLSGRYLSDDHFWFTFFHEAAHVILHDLTLPFVDEMEFEGHDSGAEEEANSYANAIIFNAYLPTAKDAKRGRRHVISVALKNGVAAGLVVGYLQHSGQLAYNRLNTLKRRYIWQGTILEMERRK